jgi:hypothetical protein
MYTQEGDMSQPDLIDTKYMDQDEKFWVFTEDKQFCDPEYDDRDSCYHMECEGAYSITASILTIQCNASSKIEAAYVFSESGDTLLCYGDFIIIAMERDAAPPNFEGN